MSEKSEVSYTLTHRVHVVTGIASEEIQVQTGTEGAMTHLHIAVPVKQFNSGNSRRDATMLETMDAEKFPLVEIFGQVTDAVPAHFPARTKRVMNGDLIFHGVRRAVSVPLELEWQSRTAVHVSGKFSVSLEAYKVERPALMFVKVEDQLRIAVSLDLQL